MDMLLVALAGFLGGMLNAIAGGGSFLTLPALVYIGVPPIAANATGTAALLPGYIASAWRFRHDIELPKGVSFRLIISSAAVGGCLGAITLLYTNEQLFSFLIPWLILFATIAFIVGPWLLQKKLVSRHHQSITKNKLKVYGPAIILLIVCIYGGYFNGGLGIILLAALSFLGQSNLQSMNGLKNIISAVLTSVAVIIYAFGGTIVIEHLLLLSVMAVLGGFFGAAISYRVPQKMMRVIIVLVGCFMSAAFFLR